MGEYTLHYEDLDKLLANLDLIINSNEYKLTFLHKEQEEIRQVIQSATLGVPSNHTIALQMISEKIFRETKETKAQRKIVEKIKEEIDSIAILLDIE